MMKRDSRVPLIIAILLLLLPVLYVGSYLALVVPEGYWTSFVRGPLRGKSYENYRCGGGQTTRRFYWYLEMLDRLARPGEWDRNHPR